MTNSQVAQEERFLFDLQGFLVLRNVLSPMDCSGLLQVLSNLEEKEYADEWIDSLGPGPPARPTKETNRTDQVRLNGLPRLDPVFDHLIDHPRVLPYLKEFVGEPQLINTWSISKFQGAEPGGYHRGVQPTDHTFREGAIRTRMLNTVYFLTENGPGDGCLVAVPGVHKCNIDLNWRDYRGLNLPGSVAVTGEPGDVLIFSEAVVHDGLPKTTANTRSNLYYNYVHTHYNPMMREPRNCHHFYIPQNIRERFSQSQRDLTAWMELAKWDF